MVKLTPAAEAFKVARDFLLAHRDDYQRAYQGFRWPELAEFNWALDWFDPLARGNHKPALWIVEQDGAELTLSFDELARRSDQVANWLRAQGVARGDRIVLMLGNQVELWESILAAMKLGAVIIPATPLLGAVDLRDRIDRGNARHVIVGAADTGKFDGVPGDYTRIAVGDQVDGWTDDVFKASDYRISPFELESELRGREKDLHSAANVIIDGEWRDEDFPELRG